MKPLLLFFAIGVLSIGNLFAQTAGIQGHVISEGKNMGFVSVIVKHTTDSSVAKTALTDTLGKFRASGLKAGSYFVELFMIGYTPLKSKAIEVKDAIIQLETLEMNKDAQSLGAVNFKVLRPIIEIQPDKTVFNVENTLNATGSDAFELLRKAPGVIIDNNNAITLEGKGGVMVYIDGKPSVLSGDDLVNFLRTVQSTDVDAIELITQPSSKYDAAGNGGIINIKLKRNKNFGTNGSLSIGHSYGKYHRGNGALSLNHRNKKVNIYSNFSANAGNRWNFVLFDRLQEGVNYLSETNTKSSVESYNAKIGADWFVSKNSIIGVLVNGNYFNADGSGTSLTEIIPLATPNAFQLLDARNESIGRNYQLTGNVNYRYADKAGRELNVDIDKGTFDRDKTTFQPNEYAEGQTGDVLYVNNYRMLTPTQIDITTAKVDYSQKLFGGKIGFGAKYSLVSTNNSFQFFDVGTEDVLNPNRSNEFIYDENVNAIYANFASSLSQKWKIQAGLRVEQTTSKGELISAQENDDDLVERNYTNLFPSGGITYAASRSHLWSLTAGRRIQRPNYQSLNPFTDQVSELSYRKGNPFLQPSYTWNSKLSHTFKYRFNSSLSYSYVSDFSAQVTDTLGTTKSFLIPRNVADQQIFNLGFSLPFSITKWWSIFANSNTSYTLYTGNDEKYISQSVITTGFYAQSSFILPKGYKLEVSGWGRTPSIWGGTYLTKSMGSINIGAEKKLLNNNMSIRLKFSDLFFTAPWRADLQYGPLVINGRGGWESQKVDFSISYNFGNSNVKASRNRETGLEEEQNRTN